MRRYPKEGELPVWVSGGGGGGGGLGDLDDDVNEVYLWHGTSVRDGLTLLGLNPNPLNPEP